MTPLTPSAEAVEAALQSIVLDSGDNFEPPGPRQVERARKAVEVLLAAALPHLRKQIVSECVAECEAVAGQMARYAVTHALGAALAAAAVGALLPDDNMIREEK